MPCRERHDLLAALLEGTGAAVAETQQRLVGYALYKATPSPAPARLGQIVRVLRRCWPWTGAGSGAELLRVAVHSAWRRQGIGRALLQEVHRAVGLRGDRIRATVPESNLPVQLFLRDGGYKAIRILPGHYDTEDGYLMEWRRR